MVEVVRFVVTPDPTPRFALFQFGGIDFSLPRPFGLHPIRLLASFADANI
jgi:hypothetical protein